MINSHCLRLVTFQAFPRRLCLLLCGLALLGVLPTAALAIPLGEIDQQNVGGDIFTNSAIGPFSFGQSFTPSLPAVDAFEFLLATDGVTAVVRIRDSVAGPDGLDGSLVAESLPVTIPADYLNPEWIHFDFPSQVPLTPGHTYLAELYYAEGVLGTRSSLGNQYTGGQTYMEGLPPHLFTGADMFFREGLHIPEPTSLVLAVFALAALLSRRR